MRNSFSFLSLFHGITGLAAFAARTADGEGCVTATCHSTLLKAKNIHPIAESCDNCHEAVVTQHPEKDKRTFKLSQDPPDLCYACHTPFGKKQHVHPPVAGGMCTSCHNPHGSDEAKLLVQPLQELCIACHPDRPPRRMFTAQMRQRLHRVPIMNRTTKQW
jgi:predicted CXXCH cytochrome family protein